MRVDDAAGWTSGYGYPVRFVVGDVVDVFERRKRVQVEAPIFVALAVFVYAVDGDCGGPSAAAKAFFIVVIDGLFRIIYFILVYTLINC